MLSPFLVGFQDELIKWAAKVPFIHGTHAPFKVLMPGIGQTVAKGDPNPRAVYTAMRGRRQKPHIEGFANKAVEQRGGTPTIASGKMDTEKGWRPRSLSAWGKKNIGDVDDALDLVDELKTAKGARRGEIWKLLNKGTGAWHNENTGEVLRVAKNRPV